MHVYRALVIVCLLPLLVADLHAENALFVLPFGGEPGAPLAYAYDYGTPPVKAGTYVMRVPSADTEVATVFSDFELTIDATTKTVLASRAARAYRSLAECSAAQTKVTPKLVLALPQPYSTEHRAWQQQSVDGTRVGGSYCLQERYLPFPVLIFELTTAPAS
ncbi:MAG: hypothetical protein EXR86_06345 [Gammaproteobacteria bacterium]|nr:hypothetical protein [Gammaproteobacteria bacterium]